MDYLAAQVFIHNCISIPSRLYNNKDVNIGKRIKHIKQYMDTNFSSWRKLKLKVKGRAVSVSKEGFIIPEELRQKFEA